MAVRASTRLSIRWPPAEASEPTDTLVLSIGDYYVDLRVAKADHSIDWALAGQMIVLSEDPLKIEFTHPYDSHYVAGQEEGAPDIGTFTRLPNGDDLETGVMPAPHLDGKIMPYEEIWHELDPGVASNEVAWILESVDADAAANVTTKSHYAKIGKYFLALRQTQSKTPLSRTYSAVRQDLTDAASGTWATTYEIGDVQGMLTLGAEEVAATAWKVGDKVTVGPQKETCIVRALGP